MKVVGIYKFAGSTGGATQVIVTFADGQQWFEREGQVDEIDVQAASGTSEPSCATRSAKALPGYTVRTGVEQAKQETSDVGSFIDILGYVLIGIGVVSTLAGAFIIFNTFWITVGQRIKELGLLRTLGASRRQLLDQRDGGGAARRRDRVDRSGVVAGLGVAKGIGALFDPSASGYRSPACTSRPDGDPGAAGRHRRHAGGVVRARRCAPPGSRRWRRSARARSCRRGWLARKGKIIAPIVAILGLGAGRARPVRGVRHGAGVALIGAGALLLLFGVALTRAVRRAARWRA